MYDLAIIGGGPAGYSAAYEAINANLSVVLFEKQDIGGTCLNRGCVPTKYLSHVARLYSDAKTSTVIEGDIRFNYGLAHSEMMHVISRLRSGITEGLTDRVTVIEGNAAINDAQNVTCNGNKYEAKNILIATGTAPIPCILSSTPCLPRHLSSVISSDELLQMTESPAELHILGGGSIAVEFANIFSALGANVSIYIRGDRLLRTWDKEIAVGITQSFKKKGIKIYTKCDFSKLELQTGTILSAMGRNPVLPQMPADLVELKDGIVVSETGETKTSHVYAAGDVIQNSPKLAHIAMEQGRNVVRHIIGEDIVRCNGNYNYNDKCNVIKCLYLDQEVASVGYTESKESKETKESSVEIVTGKATMYSNARTMISTQERGFIKISAEKHSGKIIGAQLMCERASDLIAELALAINQGLTCKQMLHSIRPHPTYCEAVTEALTQICSNI